MTEGAKSTAQVVCLAIIAATLVLALFVGWNGL